MSNLHMSIVQAVHRSHGSCSHTRSGVPTMRSKKVTLARSYSDGQAAPVARARRLALGSKASASGHFLLSGACASTRTALSRREKILLDLSRGGAAGLPRQETATTGSATVRKTRPFVGRSSGDARKRSGWSSRYMVRNVCDVRAAPTGTGPGSHPCERAQARRSPAPLTAAGRGCLMPPARRRPEPSPPPPSGARPKVPHDRPGPRSVPANGTLASAGCHPGGFEL